MYTGMLNHGNVAINLMTADKPKYPKPQKPQKEKPSSEDDSSPQPSTCQHVRILGCNESVRRITYECYKCQQGLLTECSDAEGKLQDIDVECPACGKIAIKLITGKVLSTTSIVSPWQ